MEPKSYETNVERTGAEGQQVFRVKPGRRLVIEGKTYLPGDEVPPELACRHEAFGRVAAEEREHKASKAAESKESGAE